jgi:hypothetical protein
MQEFTARFEKDIQGVMSGFDRMLFRGWLRRLTHSKGMKWYLAENNILCKKYQDPVKDISQKLKEAVLEPFQQQNLLAKQVYGRRDDENQITRASRRKRRCYRGCWLSQRMAGNVEPPHGPGRTTLFSPENCSHGSRTFRERNSFFRNNFR